MGVAITLPPPSISEILDPACNALSCYILLSLLGVDEISHNNYILKKKKQSNFVTGKGLISTTLVISSKLAP